MSLKIIGAGFPRTGTSSLRNALEMLGYDPCYHMSEVARNPIQVNFWHDILDGKTINWETIFGQYQATTDAPAAYFWRELATAYPEAKILLSVRDAEAWYDSLYRTVYQVHLKPMPTNDPDAYNWRKLSSRLQERTFHGRIEDRAYAISIFQQHNRQVQELAEPGRLLVYEVSQGWPPLCDFLGCSIPDEPFPHANTRSEFRKNLRLD